MLMSENKVIALLGIAQKAGKLASGDHAVATAVQSGKAYIMLVAADSSDNTKHKYKNMAEYYNVPYYELATKLSLGSCIGKANRACLAVIDKGFSLSIKKLLENQGE